MTKSVHKTKVLVCSIGYETRGVVLLKTCSNANILPPYVKIYIQQKKKSSYKF